MIKKNKILDFLNPLLKGGLFSVLPLLLLFSCAKTSYVPNEDCLQKVCVRPSEEIAVVTGIKPIKRKVTPHLIIIDAGHGGKDNGTASIKGPKYYEKNLTLTTSEYLSFYLNKLGYRTQMTRVADEYLELKQRSDFANLRNPTLFVSIHYNSAPNKLAEGIEVYYYQAENNKKRTEESKALAKNVLDSILKETKAKSRGVKAGNYAVIRETNMPAIIVEGGFMTNEQEMSRIRDVNYMKNLAKSIAQGINDYLAVK